jgi:replication factor C subunit 3/5
MNYLPWIEKYRPNNINEIISHDYNIQTIKKLLSSKSLPHLLFYGAPGTGKTSTIMAIAKEIYQNNIKLMVMKLDASDDRGINSVRDDIKGFAEKSNMFHKGVRLIILDEVDAMTFDAQFALRKIIEKYSSTIRFTLICNYENKIIPAIKSRCANFRFSNIDNINISYKLKYICNNENITYNDDIIDTITYLSKGDLRKAINLLQSVYLQNNTFIITKELCYDIAGIPSFQIINNILDLLYDKNKNFDIVYKVINDLITNQGYSLYTMLKEILLVIINNDSLLSKSLIIISDMATLEEMVTKSTFSDIYISYFVAIFKKHV